MKILSIILCFQLIFTSTIGHSTEPENTTRAETYDLPRSDTSPGNSTNLPEAGSAATNLNNVTTKPTMPDLNEGKTSGGAKAGNAAVIALPLLLMVHNLIVLKKVNNQLKSKGLSGHIKCMPASLVLMYSGAGVLAAGEVISYLGHRKRIKKLNAAKEKLATKDPNGTAVQSESFEMLAQNEESVRDVAETKKGFYAAGAGVFASSAALAVIETFRLKRLEAEVGKPAGPMSKDANGVNILGTPAVPGTIDKTIAVHQAQLKTATTAQQISYLNGEILKNKKMKLEKQKQIAGLRCQFENTQAKIEKINNDIQMEATKGIILDSPMKIKENANFTYLSDPENSETISLFDFTHMFIKAARPEMESDLYDEVASEEMAKLKDLSIPLKFAQQVLDQFMPSALAQDPSSTKFTPSEFHYKDGQAWEKDEKGEWVKSDEFLDIAYKKDANGNLIAPKEGEILSATKKSDIPPLQEVVVSAVSKKGQETKQVLDSMNKVSKEILRFIGKPANRAILSGVFGTYVGVMSGHFKKQQNLARERAEKLRAMKNQMNTTGGITSADPSTPNGGNGLDQNYPDRNQNIYQFSSNDFNANQKTCIRDSGDVNQSCSCAQNRSCLNHQMPRIGGEWQLSSATQSIVDKGLESARYIATGTSAAANVDVDQQYANAARIKEVAAQLDSKLNPENVKESQRGLEALNNSLMASGQALAGLGGDSLPPPLPTSAKSAADELVKELTTATQGPTATASGSSAATSEPVPEFGMNEEQLQAQDGQVEEVLANEMDLGNNDISTQKEASIFEVLSNRYRGSGFKKLIDVEPQN